VTLNTHLSPISKFKKNWSYTSTNFSRLTRLVEWRALMFYIQGGSNMTGTNCDLFTHKSSRSYLNHLVQCYDLHVRQFYHCVTFGVLCICILVAVTHNLMHFSFSLLFRKELHAVVFQKLVVTQLVNRIPLPYANRNFITDSQDPITLPYRKLLQSSQSLRKLFLCKNIRNNKLLLLFKQLKFVYIGSYTI
jgi:hypothetical protein